MKIFKRHIQTSGEIKRLSFTLTSHDMTNFWPLNVASAFIKQLL